MNQSVEKVSAMTQIFAGVVIIGAACSGGTDAELYAGMVFGVFVLLDGFRRLVS